MVGCESILDFRCIFVSELIGSVVLAIILAAIFYFIIAGKLKLGFDSTIAFGFPLILILGLAIAGLPIIIAFMTILAGILLAWIFNQIIPR